MAHRGRGLDRAAGSPSRVEWADRRAYDSKDVRSLVKGVSDRYRQSNPGTGASRRSAVPPPPPREQDFGSGRSYRGSPGSAGRARASPRTRAGASPGYRSRLDVGSPRGDVTGRIRDHMLTTSVPSAYDEPPADPRDARSTPTRSPGRSSRSGGRGGRSSRRTPPSSTPAGGDAGAGSGSGSAPGSVAGSESRASGASRPRASARGPVDRAGSGAYDYLPPQYARAKKAAQRHGHLTIDEFLASRHASAPARAPPPQRSDSSESSMTGSSSEESSDSEDEKARRLKQERAVAQLMFKQLQTHKADRKLLAAEVTKLRMALRRRSTVAGVMPMAIEEFASDKCVGTDDIPRSDQGVQVAMEMPDTQEVIDLRDLTNSLRKTNERTAASLATAAARAAALEREVTNLRAQVEHDAEKPAPPPPPPPEPEMPHVDVASKCVGTTTRWASITAEANSKVLSLVESLQIKDARLARAEDQAREAEAKVSELNLVVAEQHEKCAVLGAEVASLGRQMEIKDDEIAELKASLAAQSKALEMSLSTRAPAAAPSASSPRAEGKRRRRKSKRSSRKDEPDSPTAHSELQRPAVARRKSRIVRAAATTFLGRYETVHAANILQNSTQFGDLDVNDAKKLVSYCTIILFKEGEKLLTQGERGHFLYIILEGEVSVVVKTDSGPKEVMRRHGGQVVGEFAIFSDEPRKASVIASGRVKTLLLTRDKFMEMYTATDGTPLHDVLEKLTMLPGHARGR